MTGRVTTRMNQPVGDGGGKGAKYENVRFDESDKSAPSLLERTREKLSRIKPRMDDNCV